MSLKKSLPLIFMLFCSVVLTGCEVEFGHSPNRCTTVNNKDIDGTFGSRSVYRTDIGYETRIGYTHRGRQVLHSECAPALTYYNGQITTFNWFEYGVPIENDGITTLRFSTSNGMSQLHATRFVREGRATEEFSERPLSSNRTPTRTKAIFEGDFPFSSVEVVDNFNQEGVRQVSGLVGNTRKTQRWNENTRQYDCLYSSPSTDKIDSGCSNEITLDLEFFSEILPLEYYFDALLEPFKYQTDASKIWREVNRYP
ncbi:hypothetical protein [Vibrio sp. WXL103]|uniref:hypothetical protein n=1 Tax=unclassified Vibrio TaxID=2614977 RepID=UPI003EC505DE